MPEHSQAVELEFTVLEAEIAAHAVERLAGGAQGRSLWEQRMVYVQGIAAIVVKGTQAQGSVVAGPGRTGSLHLFANIGVAFQVKALGDTDVDVLRVSHGRGVVTSIHKS